jgi:hypothetical protein
MYAFITWYLFSQLHDSTLCIAESIGIAQKQIHSKYQAVWGNVVAQLVEALC